MGVPTFKITRGDNGGLVMTQIAEAAAKPAEPDGLIGQWYWHVHHESTAEPLSFPLQERLDAIKNTKPVTERPIRITAMTRVRGTIPEAIQKLAAPLVEAGRKLAEKKTALAEARRTISTPTRVRYEAEDALYAAQSAVDTLLQSLDRQTAQSAEMQALHRAEHPSCPWNGKTILPFGRR